MANDSDIRDLYSKNPRDMTDSEVDRVIHADDRELLRLAQNVPEVAVLVATWRLRTRIEKEERAIKVLTAVLVVLTLVLVFFGFADFLRH